MNILGLQGLSGNNLAAPGMTGSVATGLTGGVPGFAVGNQAALRSAEGATGIQAGASLESLLATQMAMMQTMMNMMLLILLQLMQGKGVGAAGGLQGLLGNAGGTGAAGGAGGTNAGAGTTGTSAAYDPSAGGSNVKRPNGYSEIVATFGRPGDSSNLVTERMPAGPGGKMVSVTVHKKIAGKLKAAFEEIKAQGLSSEIKSFDGTYNPRKKRGGSTWSTHAWGIAVDINAGQYPMGTSNSNTSARYKQIAAIMAKYGFSQVPNDPMHFQYASGY